MSITKHLQDEKIKKMAEASDHEIANPTPKPQKTREPLMCSWCKNEIVRYPVIVINPEGMPMAFCNTSCLYCFEDMGF